MSTHQLSFEQVPTKQNSLPVHTFPLNDQGKSVLAALEQNMQQQDNQRWKNKFQRFVKQKDRQIEQLNSRLSALEKEKKTLTTINKTITTQYHSLKEAFQQQQKQYEKTINKVKSDQSNNSQSLQRINQILKQQMKQLEAQIAGSMNKQEHLSRQHQKQVKTINNFFEEKIKKIENLLAVKEQQQLKVEEMLRNKKKELGSEIVQKDQTIQKLVNQKKKIEARYKQLQQKMIEKQQINKKTVQDSEKIVCQLKSRLQTLQQQYSLLEEAAQLSIQCLIDELGLTSKAENVLPLIDLVKQQLKIKLASVNKQQIVSLQNSLSQCLERQKQLLSKINILQQQAKFSKDLLQRNSQVTSLIKKHLQQQVVKKQQPRVTPMKKTFEKPQIKPNPTPQQREWLKNANEFLQCSKKIELCLQSKKSQLEHKKVQNKASRIINSRQNALNQISCNQMGLKNRFSRQKSSALLPELQRMPRIKQEFDLWKRPQDETYNNTQSQCKKRRESLVYSMYRKNPILNDSPACFQQKSQKLIQKRSNSMKQFVRLSCQQQLFQN